MQEKNDLEVNVGPKVIKENNYGPTLPDLFSFHYASNNIFFIKKKEKTIIDESEIKDFICFHHLFSSFF